MREPITVGGHLRIRPFNTAEEVRLDLHWIATMNVLQTDKSSSLRELLQLIIA